MSATLIGNPREAWPAHGRAKTVLNAVRTVVSSLGVATLAVGAVIAWTVDATSLPKVRTVVLSFGVATIAVGVVIASTADAAPLPKVRTVVAPLRVVTTVE
jgi:hypothetical protein